MVSFSFGIEEKHFPAVPFDQLSLQEEGGVVCHARGLLLVVRGQEEWCNPALALHEEFLDLGGGDRVQRGGGFIQQDHFRFKGQHAGQAQPLLLPAGKGIGRIIQPVVDLIPQHGLAQCFFHLAGDLLLVLLARHFQPKADIFGDRQRQGDRAGEDNTHPPAQLDHIDFRVKDIDAIQKDLSADLLHVREVDQPVEHADQGGFAAAGRAKGDIDLVGDDVQVDARAAGIFRPRSAGAGRGC